MLDEISGVMTSTPSRDTRSIEETVMDRLDLNSPRREVKMPLRLKPSLGRTVQMHTNLANAFRTLERRCNDNNVKGDSIKQRFHVRKGQQRKINRRVRWRALFKDGFIAECDRIRRMKKQGW
jgi:hypothetical protein